MIRDAAIFIHTNPKFMNYITVISSFLNNIIIEILFFFSASEIHVRVSSSLPFHFESNNAPLVSEALRLLYWFLSASGSDTWFSRRQTGSPAGPHPTCLRDGSVKAAVDFLRRKDRYFVVVAEGRQQCFHLLARSY